MFFQCNSMQQIWWELALIYSFPLLLHISIPIAFGWWCRQRVSLRLIFIITLWCAWRWRNNKIFNGAKEPLSNILHDIVLIYDSVPRKPTILKKAYSDVLTDSFLRSPRAFFDGVAHKHTCGWEVVIYMDENLHYYLSWNVGRGTNNLAEAKALAGLLAF